MYPMCSSLTNMGLRRPWLLMTESPPVVPIVIVPAFVVLELMMYGGLAMTGGSWQGSPARIRKLGGGGGRTMVNAAVECEL